MIDLHLHTTLSDGKKTVPEIIEMASMNNIKTLAITNHDSTEDLTKYHSIAYSNNIKLISGIELSSTLKGGLEIHILGYFVDSNNEQLNDICNQLLISRKKRMEKMISKLSDQGILINYDKLSLGEKGLASRTHLACQLVEKGYSKTVSEAMGKYLSPGCYAYEPYMIVTPLQAITLINNAKGQAVLAHPMRYRLSYLELWPLIESLKNQGLEGLEV